MPRGKNDESIGISSREVGRWEKWGAALVGGLLLAGGPILATLLPVIVEEAHAGYWIMGGIVLTVAGVGVTVWNQRRSIARDQRAAGGLTHFNDALSGLHKPFATLILTEQVGDADRKRFLESVVGATSALFQVKGVRVCAYQLEDTDGDEEGDQYLTLVDSAGRHDEPRAEFRSGTPHGDAAIATANGNRYVCVNDWEKPGHPVDHPPGTTWESFLQVPLRNSFHPLGLLTVDSREKQVFTPEHVAIAQAAAWIIALGMAHMKLQSDDAQPELAGVFAALRDVGEQLDTQRANRGTSQASATLEEREEEGEDG